MILTLSLLSIFTNTLHIDVLVPELEKDQWIAVDMGGLWYPGQFEQYDKEEESLKVHFLHPSQSSSEKFVWPDLGVFGKQDCSWIKEGLVFFDFRC